MNSFSGLNAHHVPAITGTPITIRIHLLRDSHEPVFVFIVFSRRNGQCDLPDSPSLLFESLKLLQRRRPEVRIETLAVDRNRPELCQVRPRWNLVILVAFISLQLPSSTFSVLSFRKLASSIASFVATRITCTSGPFEVLKLVSRRISFPSAS